MVGKSIENVAKCCNLLTLSSRRYFNDVASVYKTIYISIKNSEFLVKNNGDSNNSRCHSFCQLLSMAYYQLNLIKCITNYGMCDYALCNKYTKYKLNICLDLIRIIYANQRY